MELEYQLGLFVVVISNRKSLLTEQKELIGRVGPSERTGRLGTQASKGMGRKKF